MSVLALHVSRASLIYIKLLNYYINQPFNYLMLSYTVFLFYCVSIICSSKRMAVKNKRPSRYLIVQSDIGSQYRCNNYYKSIKKRKFRSWVLKRVNFLKTAFLIFDICVRSL